MLNMEIKVLIVLLCSSNILILLSFRNLYSCETHFLCMCVCVCMGVRVCSILIQRPIRVSLLPYVHPLSLNGSRLRWTKTVFHLRKCPSWRTYKILILIFFDFGANSDRTPELSTHWLSTNFHVNQYQSDHIEWSLFWTSNKKKHPLKLPTFDKWINAKHKRWFTIFNIISVQTAMPITLFIVYLFNRLWMFENGLNVQTKPHIQLCKLNSMWILKICQYKQIHSSNEKKRKRKNLSQSTVVIVKWRVHWSMCKLHMHRWFEFSGAIML